jgi:Tol biopolymer transport system component
MKTGIRTIVVLFMACLLGASVFSISQSASALFEQGLMKENAEGDLAGAILVFNRVLADQSADPSIRAKAQLHIGMCFEKLGQGEARAAYQKVIDGYPQQIQEVALARERMARLASASKEDATRPIFRKLNFPNRLAWDAQLSPDGRNIALVNEKKLWIVPISSKLGPGFPGTPKLLNTAGIEVDFCGITWSGDGQWIAFNRDEYKKASARIYVISAAGGNPREIYENNRHTRVVNYRMSLSPNGETIAFSSMDADGLHIYKMLVAGGAPQRLVDTLAREPVFSPDGKMIAYVEDKELGSAGGGLWIVPANGGLPKLVADAGNASTPIWSPDGRMVAFVDYAAAKKIHIVQLGPEGNPAGEQVSIDCPQEISEVRRLVGWTPDNVIGAVVGTPIEFSLYAQPVDGGKARFVTHGGYPVQPRWSPDGKWIYHVNNAGSTGGDWQRYAIARVPSEGGNVTAIPLQSETKINIWAYGASIRVSPDGRSIVFAGQKPQEGEETMHIWTLPVEGGASRQLTDAPVRDWYPCWSPDGRNIAFVRATPPENWTAIGKANIFVVPAEGGEPRQITSESDRVFAGPVMWSPDGSCLAYFSRDRDDDDVGTIKIIPANGGIPKVVTKVRQIFANKEMAWSPDGRRIAFNALRPESRNTIVSDTIKIVSLDDGSIQEIVPDLKDVKEFYHLDWSPDGKTLVFGGYTGGGPELWLMEDFLPLVKTGK